MPFKKGQSGNPSGRPKEVTDWARKNRMKWYKKLEKIALEEPLELKDPATGELVEVIPPQSVSAQVKAIDQLTKIAGDYAPEVSEVQITDLTDDERKARVAALLKKASKRGS